MMGLNNFFAWLSFVVFISCVVIIRNLKYKILYLRKKKDMDFKIEDIALFETFKTENFLEEFILIITMLFSIALSNISKNNFLLSTILILTLLFLSLGIVRAVFFNKIIEQPYFDKKELFEIEEGSIINEDFENTLKKHKLLGKTNNFARKNEIFKFVKNKIRDNKIKKIILFFYFYFFFFIQILLLTLGIIYWITEKLN